MMGKKKKGNGVGLMVVAECWLKEKGWKR